MRYNELVNDRAIGRAAFLGLVGAGVAGLFIGRDATRVIGSVVPAQVRNIVPSSGWRIYTIAARMPSIRPEAYRLRIEGAVERPVTLTLSELRALPRARQVSDFHCVTGWSVDDVTWGGVRFKDVLAQAGLLPAAKALRFVSDEVPYDDTLTLKQALLPDVMLAFDMDGKPLRRPHGAPARVVMPRMYGYKSVKWVTRIEVLEDDSRLGYWEQWGYDKDAWVDGSNGFTA